MVSFQALGLKWEHGTSGERNRIERWFRTMKARTRRFFNNFPVRKNQSSKSNFYKALRPLVQLHKTTPNTKKTTSNAHNLTVSNKFKSAIHKKF